MSLLNSIRSNVNKNPICFSLFRRNDINNNLAPATANLFTSVSINKHGSSDNSKQYQRSFHDTTTTAFAAESSKPKSTKSTTSTDMVGEKKPKDTSVTMNDLAKVVAEKHDITLKESKAILDTIVNTVIESLVQENTKVRLNGLGIFKTMHSKERQYRNLQNGELFMVPAKERVKFTAMSSVKKLLNPEPKGKK